MAKDNEEDQEEDQEEDFFGTEEEIQEVFRRNYRSARFREEVRREAKRKSMLEHQDGIVI